MLKSIKYQYIILLFCSFCFYFILDKVFFATIYKYIDAIFKVEMFSFFLTYIVVGLPVFLFVFITNHKTVFKPLGLQGNFIKGLCVALGFSLPMLLGFGILNDFQVHITLKDFIISCLFAAFFEELYYRGFFFGQLFRKSGLGFFPSLFIGAILFASLHAYQSDLPLDLLGIFLTTFLGAGLFAWLYVEWSYNLWVPIALHFFMNLSWSMYAVSDNAFGGWIANLIRALTIILAITSTIIYKRKMNIPFGVVRKTLWINYKNYDPFTSSRR